MKETFLADTLLDEARTLLRHQRTRLQDALARVTEALSAMDIPPTLAAANDAPTASEPATRHMTAAARAAVSKRMKAYWRKRRKAGAKGK